jgi:cobalt-zinc-cadmium resistance protein CzcA
MSRAIGSETQRPIVVLIVGGTISAAALTLLVLPVLCDLLDQVRDRMSNRQRRAPA